jgi:predicted dehydrogenase
MSQATTPQVRFAYVGCGFVAQNIHIPNFRALPDCSFHALAELRPGLGERVAARYGIPKVYRSHEEIARDPDIEAVGVSAPPGVQDRIAEELVRAGKHVFMEKPMAVSVTRAQAMVAAVKAGSARLMVGYMKRYDPGNLALKQRLEAWRSSGEAGRVLFARNHGFGGNWVSAQDPNVPFEQPADPAPTDLDESPRWLPEKWRGPYLSYCEQWTHNLNLLRFFLGDDGGKTRVVSVSLDQDGYTGIVVLDIAGVRAVVESAWTNYHAWEEHTQVYFEGGWLKTGAPPLLHKEEPASVEVYRAGAHGTPPRLSVEYAAPAWSYREEARHFLECVRTGAPFRSSAEDTLYDVKLYEDIYRAFLGL